MRGNRHMDKHIREKLEHYAPETPMHLWDKIDEKRSARKLVVARANRWKMYTAIAILLLIHLGLGIWVVDQDQSIATDITDTAIQSDINKENQADVMGISTPSSTTHSNKEEQTALNQTASTNFQEASVNKSIETLASKNIVSTTNSNSKKSTTSQTVIRTTSIVNKSDLNTITTTRNVVVSKNEEKYSQPILTPITEQSVINNTTNDIATRRSILDEDLSKLSNTKTKLLDRPLLAIDQELDLPDVKCAAFQKRRNGMIYAVDVFFSPERAYKTLEAKDEEYEEYIQKRNETESSYYSFSTGVRFSVMAPNGFVTRAGIVYSQINEIFDYVDPDATQTTTTTTTTTTIGPDGTVTTVQSTETEELSGTRFKTTINRYRMIDIPVTLGYQVELSKFVLNINAGASFNVLFHKKGDILGLDMEPVSFSSNNANAFPAFKDKLGASLFGSIGVSYKINNRVLLIFEPNFKYQLRSITQDNYLVNQKYFTTGLITGLRYRF